MSIFINGIDRTPVNSLVLLNAAAGNEVANRMDYTVNKAAGNDTGLVINQTDTLSPGTSLIQDWQREGVSKANINNVGTFYSTKLLLPQVNEPTTPTLAFGDGDTGFFEISDDIVWLSLGGVAKWAFTSGYIYAPSSVYISNSTPTATIPNLCPLNSDTNTGIGWAAADQLSLIAGGVEGIRITEATTCLTNITSPSALTSTVLNPLKLTHYTSDTPANGIGVGLEFEQETSASNNEIIATIEAVVTDVTGASEDADIVIKNMTGGAAATEKLRIRSTGVCGHSSLDNAASPVAPTNPLNTFFYNASKADDAVITCPAITTSAYGIVILGTAEEYARFIIDNDGDVTLLDNSANVVANVDTDTKLCIGTAAAQEPLQIKNRLGGTKVLNVMMWYD